MRKKITAELVHLQSRQAMDLEVGQGRAGELAGEVEPLIRSVAHAAATLDFNDEPAHFATALVRLGAAGVRGK